MEVKIWQNSKQQRLDSIDCGKLGKIDSSKDLEGTADRTKGRKDLNKEAEQNRYNC